MTPLVSILVPCHNAAPWLTDTLGSALAQTASPCEVIVVDDGSTDASLVVARGFESRGVRVISQANRGASAARNHGLRLARGKYIQFLDADDLLASDKIARQLGLLAAAPPDSIAAATWGRFDHDPARAVITIERNWGDYDPIEWLTLNFAGEGMMPPAAWLTPRTLIDAAGPWDERLTLNDDGEYFCRVLLRSAGVKFCPDAITYYRSNLAGSLSRHRSPAAWQSAYLSHELCASQLLARENSPRTNRACADLFQRLAFAMFPDCPELVATCETRARIFGGSAQHPGGGRIFRILSQAIGWKLARQLQLFRQQNCSRRA